MKLSEILKDWPENKTCKLHTNYRGFRCDTCYFVREENKSITSCDREIDREALAKIEFESRLGIKWDDASDELKEPFRVVADHIISTMPTWLKGIEE